MIHHAKTRPEKNPENPSLQGPTIGTLNAVRCHMACPSSSTYWWSKDLCAKRIGGALNKTMHPGPPIK